MPEVVLGTYLRDWTSAPGFAATSSTSIVAETSPRWALNNGNLSPTKGTVHLRRIRLKPGAYTTLTYVKGTTAGTALANCYAALFDVDDNSRLALSAESSTAWGAASTGTVVTTTLSATITTEKDYYLAILVGNSSTTALSFCGLTTQANAYLYLTPSISPNHTSTGLDAVPSSVTPTTSGSGVQMWLRYE